LKEDMELLSKLFPTTHERFQITRYSPSEGIQCIFIDANGQKIPLSATLKEDTSRSSVSAIWYTDVEQQHVSDTLASVTGENAFLIQVRKVINSLCSIYNVAPPAELSQLVARLTEPKKDSCPSSVSDGKMDDDTDWFLNEDESNESTSASDVPSETIVEKKLEKAQAENLKKRLKGFPAGTPTANHALMKQFKEIQKSDSVAKGVFAVDLIDDNLFQWCLKIKQVDSDSKLAEDLKALKAKNGQDYIHLVLRFAENFPFEPPIVSVVSPRMIHGHVIDGAICLELLTREGWSSVYTVEGIIMQIMTTFVKGDGRINFDNMAAYDMQTAASWAMHLEEFHKTQGWYTPPKGSG